LLERLTKAERSAAWSDGQIHKIQGTLAQLASERDLAQAELSESRAQLVRTMNREAKLEAEIEKERSTYTVLKQALVTEWKSRDQSTPTHYCKVCNAFWFCAEPDPSSPHDREREGYWHLVSATCGKCCDNVAMGDQIAAWVPGWAWLGRGAK
jgi:hypothetical protein